MKDLILFFGAGISIPSGFPSVSMIDDLLFVKKYKIVNKAFVLSDENDDVVDEIQSFLTMLRDWDNHYLINSAPFYKGNVKGNDVIYTGSIYRTQSNYEVLYYFCEQIEKWKQGLLDSLPFSLLVEKLSGHYASELSIDNADAAIKIGKIASNSMDFIQAIVTQKLMMQADEVKGLDLIIELALSKEINKINIITLNHDTLIETIFNAKGIDYDDGFNDDGEVCTFVGYEENSKIKIIKPHGGINWYQGYRNGMELHFKPKGELKSKYIDAKGEQINRGKAMPAILTGAGKIESYNYTTFADVMHQVHTSLKSTSTMVMCGYGWGDAAINARLSSWLQNNNHLLILLHPSAKDLIASSNFLEDAWDMLELRGKLKIVPQWIMTVKMADIGL